MTTPLDGTIAVPTYDSLVNPKLIELTPEQARQWSETMTLMAWTAPGFRHLFFKLLTNNNGQSYAFWTREVPIAATDGKNILLNPDTFFALNMKERVYALAHEVLHNVYNDVNLVWQCHNSGTVPLHDGTTLPYDNTRLQHAMDYRINALLQEGRIGQVIKGTLCDPSIATGKDSVFDVYKKLYEADGGQPRGGGAFDQVLKPGTSTGQDPQSAASGRSQQQWQVETATAAALEEKKQGRGAGLLKRFFKDLLEPEIPWTEHIQSLVRRATGSEGYNWKRANRRYIIQDIFAPSKSGFGAGWIVVWGDTSGSIGQAELNKYMGELSGIIDECHPRRLTVVWCDDAVQKVDELEDSMDLERVRAEGPGNGGGGTSCDPVFAWIKDEMETPDLFIGFTDGYVTFPHNEPAFPVIWAMTTDKNAPFGDHVRIHPERR